MEKILREQKIEVVISAIGGGRISDQLILVEAIKAVGTVKVMLTSETEKKGCGPGELGVLDLKSPFS